MDTYCGIVLKGEEDTECAVAFIGEDGVATHSTTDDEEIMALLEEHRPQVVALNAPQQHDHEQIDTNDDGFREKEQELVDDGHSMLPPDMRSRRLLERAEFLSNTIKRSGLGSTIIESNPDLIARELEITGDQALEAYGVNTDPIDNVYEFDALLLALTAKFYADDQYDDKNIILPDMSVDEE